MASSGSGCSLAYSYSGWASARRCARGISERSRSSRRCWRTFATNASEPRRTCWRGSSQGRDGPTPVGNTLPIDRGGCLLRCAEGGKQAISAQPIRAVRLTRCCPVAAPGPILCKADHPCPDRVQDHVPCKLFAVSVFLDNGRSAAAREQVSASSMRFMEPLGVGAIQLPHALTMKQTLHLAGWHRAMNVSGASPQTDERQVPRC